MRWVVALVLTLVPMVAAAQSVPNGTITQGLVWTPAQWNFAWQSKADVTGGVFVAPDLGTPTVLVLTNATGLPNAGLLNSSMTIGGQVINLGGATVNQGTGGKIQTSSGITTTGNCVKFDSSGSTIDAGAPCGSGAGSVTSVGVATPNSTLSLGGTNPVTSSGTINVDLNLANANIWTATQTFTNGTLSLKGSSSGSGTLEAPAAASSYVWTLPAATANLAYQVGAITGGHVLVASGTAGGVADGGALPAGTVTAVSVASANGFAGTSSGGATPALTLSTTITGALKGNGTAVSQAACADLSNGAASCSTDTTNAGNISSGTLPNARLSAVPLTALATQAANTVVANVTSGSAAPTAASLPGCTDTGGNHLNYTSGTGFSCGTSGGGTVIHYPAVEWDSGTTVTAVTIPLFIGPGSGTIGSIAYYTGGASASFVAAVQINGVAVTGCTAITVSSATVATATCTAANTFSANDKVTVVTSSIVNSPTQAEVQVKWQ